MARNVVTAVDSADFFVEARDSTPLNITATATGTQSAADQLNTLQKGAFFFITVASLSVNTATLAVNVNAKDPASGNYFNLARVSLDGIVNASANSSAVFVVYVGAVATASVATAFSLPLPRTMQVQATLSITTTASMSGLVSYKIGQSKVL